ncbi:MAG: tetratricopeptide repeat protein [Nitrospinae bacterium]|nr:tetratricopeptide repeat protein [Nitrospinota bacterium]
MAAPRRGLGLRAIIRDTTGDPVPGELSRAEVEALRRSFEEAAKGKEAELEALRAKLREELPGPEEMPMAVAALREKARQFEQRGNLLDAFHLYRRIIRLDPRDTGALYQLAALYYSVELTEKAAEILTMILEIDPGQTRAAESLNALKDQRGGRLV